MLFDPLQSAFIIFLMISGLWQSHLAASLPLNKRLWTVLALIFTSEDSFHACFRSADGGLLFSNLICISLYQQKQL